jgi:hypothetical protein
MPTTATHSASAAIFAARMTLQILGFFGHGRNGSP